MQSLEARQAYRNSFHCAYRIFTEEGLFRFWTGTTPRLARLVVRILLLVARYTADDVDRLVEWWYRVHCLREHDQIDRRQGGMSKNCARIYVSSFPTELAVT